MPKPYVAAYMRVSSRNGRQTTDSQRHAIKQYIRTNRLRNVQWFEDKATGRTTKREQLQTILDDCRDGKCQTLILWKLDRLSRSCRDTLNLLAGLADKGVTVVIVSQGLTLDDSAIGRAMIQLMGLVAELESNFISERIRAGLEVAKKNGVQLGRKNDDKKRARIQRLTDKGYSVSEIAVKMNCSKQAVYQMQKRIAATNDE